MILILFPDGHVIRTRDLRKDSCRPISVDKDREIKEDNVKYYMKKQEIQCMASS